MSSNIELRHNTYYATLHVPNDVRDIIGKSKLIKSLETSNKRLACDRAKLIVGQWKAQIRQARALADPLTVEALKFRNAIEGASSRNSEESESYILLALDKAERIEQLQGIEKAIQSPRLPRETHPGPTAYRGLGKELRFEAQKQAAICS